MLMMARAMQGAVKSLPYERLKAMGGVRAREKFVSKSLECDRRKRMNDNSV